MTPVSTRTPCDPEQVALHALAALPPEEAQQFETHLAECQTCRDELESLRPVVDSFCGWPTDLLRPSTTVWDRLAQRIAAHGPRPQVPRPPADEERLEEPWQEAAPGVCYKVLATDPMSERVSMLVRLAPGAAYPPHTHAGTEELHLLAGELWIENRKLYPGEYNRADRGSSDQRVWSDTGCTCVLITSLKDVLGSKT